MTARMLDSGVQKETEINELKTHLEQLEHLITEKKEDRHENTKMEDRKRRMDGLGVGGLCDACVTGMGGRAGAELSRRRG